MPLLSSPRFALAAACIGAAVLAAPAAHAFTMQDESASGTDQSFLYPNKGLNADSSQSQSEGFKQQDGMTTFKDGNTTLQFGHRPSFNEQYNPDQIFAPLGRPPGVR